MSQPLCLIMVFAAVGCAASPDTSGAVRDSVTPMQCGRAWRRLEGALPPARMFPSVTDAGESVLLFGGVGAEGPLGDGWRWDGDAWRAISTHGAPTARAGHVAVWTGDALCVWGGEAGGRALGDGACWSAASDTWTAMSSANAPGARTSAGACWTGREVMLFGGADAEGNPLGEGYAWSPTTNRWRALSGVGAPRARTRPVLAMWSRGDRDEVAVWGGAGDELALGAEDAARYDLAGDAWASMDIGGAPRASTGPLAAVLPEGVLAMSRDGLALLDARTGLWRGLANEGAPSAEFGATMTALRGGAWVHDGHDGACYELSRARWLRAPREGAPEKRSGAVTLWDGRRLLVLWGRDERGLRDDGWALDW